MGGTRQPHHELSGSESGLTAAFVGPVLSVVGGGHRGSLAGDAPPQNSGRASRRRLAEAIQAPGSIGLTHSNDSRTNFLTAETRSLISCFFLLRDLSVSAV
jgi:hypothetical protein